MYDKFYAEGNFSSFAAFSKESNPRSGDGLDIQSC